MACFSWAAEVVLFGLHWAVRYDFSPKGRFGPAILSPTARAVARRRPATWAALGPGFSSRDRFAEGGRFAEHMPVSRPDLPRAGKFFARFR